MIYVCVCVCVCVEGNEDHVMPVFARELGERERERDRGGGREERR